MSLFAVSFNYLLVGADNFSLCCTSDKAGSASSFNGSTIVDHSVQRVNSRMVLTVVESL